MRQLTAIRSAVIALLLIMVSDAPVLAQVAIASGDSVVWTGSPRYTTTDLQDIGLRLIDVVELAMAFQEAGGRDATVAESVVESAQTVGLWIHGLRLGYQLMNLVNVSELEKQAAWLHYHRNARITADMFDFQAEGASAFGVETQLMRRVIEDYEAIADDFGRLVRPEP